MKEPTLSELLISQEAHMELPEALQEPTRTKNLLFLVLYGVANMVIGVANITLATVMLPTQIGALTSGEQTGIFSLILGVGAVASVLTNPLVGMFSDRTTSRFGRRRPWLIVGGVITVAAVFLLSIASSVLAVAIEWIILEVGINLIVAALSAILPDQVPVRQRATLSAFAAGFGTLLGGLFGQILVTQFFKGIQAGYSAIAITVVIMIALFLLVLRDVPLSKEHVPPFRIKQIFAAYWLNPVENRDFFLTWLSRCFIFLGYTTVVNFMFYYLHDAVQYEKLFPGQTTAQGVQTFFAVNVGSILVASLVGGILSDKLQRRKPFVIASSLIMVVALSLYAFFPTWSMVLVGTAVLGFGFGIFLAVDLALASQVLPTASDRGKDIGIINTAIFIPMILSPVIAGVMLGTLHSYLALFVLLAVASLFSAVLIMPIKRVR